MNMFLRNMDSGSEVIIRTVSSFDKVLDTRPMMKDRFQVCVWVGGCGGVWVGGWVGACVCMCVCVHVCARVCTCVCNSTILH